MRIDDADQVIILGLMLEASLKKDETAAFFLIKREKSTILFK
jgi:hypothetical protein